MTLSTLTHLCIVYCLVSLSTATTDFYVDGVFHSSLNSPSIRLKDTNFEVAGTVVLGNPTDACTKIKNVNEVSGNILFVHKKKSSRQCPMENVLSNARDANVSAVIFENSIYAGGFGFLAYYTNWELSKIHLHDLHAVEIEESNSLVKKLEKNESVITAIVRDGTNWIQELDGPLIAYSVIYGLWSIGIIVTAIYKWRLFVMAGKLRPSVSQICLCLEIIAGVLRIFSLVDPPYTRGIYPGIVTAAWDLFIWPIVLSSTLLMTFYWEEAMRTATIHSYPTLYKMKIPFGICVFLLMFFACLAVVFRAKNINLGVGNLASGVIILIFTIPITIFYCVAAIQVLSRLYKSTSLSKREASLYRMTAFLAGDALSMIGIIIFVFLLAVLPMTKNWFIVAKYGLYLFGSLTSTFQVLAFQNPALSSSSGSKSNVHRSRSSVNSTTMHTIHDLSSRQDSSREMDASSMMEEATSTREEDMSTREEEV